MSPCPRVPVSPCLRVPVSPCLPCHPSPPNSWHRGQMKLLVLPVLIFSMGAAQAGHGWPSLYPIRMSSRVKPPFCPVQVHLVERPAFGDARPQDILDAACQRGHLRRGQPGGRPQRMQPRQNKMSWTYEFPIPAMMSWSSSSAFTRPFRPRRSAARSSALRSSAFDPRPAVMP